MTENPVFDLNAQEYRPLPQFDGSKKVPICAYLGTTLTPSSAMVVSTPYFESKSRKTAAKLANGFDTFVGANAVFEVKTQSIKIETSEQTVIVQSLDPHIRIVGRHPMTQEIGTVDIPEAAVIGAYLLLLKNALEQQFDDDNIALIYFSLLKKALSEAEVNGLAVLKETRSGKYALTGHGLLFPVGQPRNIQQSTVVLGLAASESWIKRTLSNPNYRPFTVIIPKDPIK